MPEYHRGHKNGHAVAAGVVSDFCYFVLGNANSRVLCKAEQASETGRNIISSQLNHFDVLLFFTQVSITITQNWAGDEVGSSILVSSTRSFPHFPLIFERLMGFNVKPSAFDNDGTALQDDA